MTTKSGIAVLAGERFRLNGVKGETRMNRERMHIGVVVQTDYPDDTEVRARKIAKTLYREGYSPYIIGRNARGRGSLEKLDYAMVCRVPCCKIQWLCKIISAPIPVNLLWVLWVLWIIRAHGIKLVISRNIALCLQVALAAKIARIPLILDLSENNPAAVEARGKESLIHYITRNRKLVAFLERLCITLADHVWVVAEENAERLITLGVSKAKISVVSNTPELDENVSVKDRGHITGTEFTLVYVGLINKFRGLDLVIKSMPYVITEDSQIKLVIVGDGEYRRSLEELATSLKVRDKVQFIGWVSYEKLRQVIARSNVGLIPHQVTEHTNTTIPNKLFDYMACGIPVLSTPISPVRRIIEQEQCGLIISPDDPKAVASIILELKRVPQLCSRMGMNGQKAVREKYNWQIESEKILSSIKALISNKERR